MRLVVVEGWTLELTSYMMIKIKTKLQYKKMKKKKNKQNYQHVFRSSHIYNQIHNHEPKINYETNYVNNNNQVDQEI